MMLYDLFHSLYFRIYRFCDSEASELFFFFLRGAVRGTSLLYFFFGT